MKVVLLKIFKNMKEDHDQDQVQIILIRREKPLIKNNIIENNMKITILEEKTMKIIKIKKTLIMN